MGRTAALRGVRKMRERSRQDQTHRASGPNVLCAAIAPWNTVYAERASGS